LFRTAIKVTDVGLKLNHPTIPIMKSLPTEAELGCDNVLWYKSKLKHFFFYVDKSNAYDVENVKTEPGEVEDKEFKEDKKALVPSPLRLDHSMLYCPP
jgi:hypothetical protein